MIAFCDEVGCASIFGPCVVCCCAVPDNYPLIPGVKDSKQLSRQKRDELYPIIATQLQYAFGSASPNKIEQKNIHYAKLEAMKIAVERLARTGVKIDKVIVDGSFTIPNLDFPQEAVVKADAKFWQCGAASILAKVRRDNAMTELGKIDKYSYYDLGSNAGYYTVKHRNGIILMGPTELHRKNFGYFKYCLARRNEYLEFIAKGGDLAEYYHMMADREVSTGKSDYVLWRDGAKENWQDIKYGDTI